MTKEEEFEKWINKINRDGIGELYQWLKTTDFFTAPASSLYHNNIEGGLLDHSINVLNILIDLYKSFKEKYNIDDINNQSIIIVALLHDLCKINQYTLEEKWTKVNGIWAKYIGWNTQDDFPLGHGNKSVYLINKFMKLTDEEAMAINFHMGAYSDDKFSCMKAFNICPLARLLNVADLASLVIEPIRDYKKEILE